MSDILIRGMEMPRNCEECDVKVVCKNYWKLIREQYTRPSWCPLVPVPPHGRLVDALWVRDQIIKQWMDYSDDSHMYKRGMEDAYEVIRNAPTVIPASEEVYASGYDTAGNYHFCGTRTGEHIIKDGE